MAPPIEPISPTKIVSSPFVSASPKKTVASPPPSPVKAAAPVPVSPKKVKSKISVASPTKVSQSQVMKNQIAAGSKVLAQLAAANNNNNSNKKTSSRYGCGRKFHLFGFFYTGPTPTTVFYKWRTFDLATSNFHKSIRKMVQIPIVLMATYMRW